MHNTNSEHNTNSQEKKVLDHGLVRLVDFMGSDESIVQAARVSYGAGTTKQRNTRNLLRYLLRNAHTSPFEQVIFVFHIKLPIFVARQLLRHRTARLNEISARYSVMKEEFYIPDGSIIAKQDKKNKQSREDVPFSPAEQEKVRSQLKEHYEQAYRLYESLLEQGLAREIARICLPVSLYTEMYWQIDLHNLFHFLFLRLHPHSQYEMQVYAQAMLDIIKPLCPLAAEAFCDYILHKTEFYSYEYPIVKKFLQDKEREQSEDDFLDDVLADTEITKGERELLAQKLKQIDKSKT